MTDNTYWQFQQSMVDPTPIMLPQQQQQQSTSNQSIWPGESDKSKWGQEFNDFDMDGQGSKTYNVDEYSNLSEGDSPGADSGNFNKRNDLAPELQGGDQKQRRKEQNRAAQRAFRERKERYVKELEVKIKEMENKHNQELSRVTTENESLKAMVKKMEAEIYTLKGAAMAFDISIHKLREAGMHNRDQPSPPTSDHHSPDLFSPRPSTHNNDRRHMHDSAGRYNHKSTLGYAGQSMAIDDEVEEFAERETTRFEHKVDPIMTSGIKVIPCSQIWERLSQHPRFDEYDVEKLCEELKKKAKCSGTGPVIPEFELLNVLKRMDDGTA